MTHPTSPYGDLAPIQKPVQTASHTPGGLYNDPELFKLEQQQIFLSEWIMVAREEEVANPGDYLTARIFSEPLLLSRDKDGVLRAFANVCRHRGVEVAFGSGNAKLFTCPYHGWTYRQDGTLLGAPTASKNTEFDKSSCRLPTVAMGIWGGNIFVNFAENPSPFEDFAAALEARFGFLHPERCRIGAKGTIAQGCNWKFTVENLVDFYHVQVLHVGTIGKEFHLQTENITSEKGWVEARYKGAPTTPDMQSLFGKMPWLEGHPDDLGLSSRIPPNLHIFARMDMVAIMTIWPESVDSCSVTVNVLFPEEASKQPGFKEKAEVYLEYIRAITEEDNLAVESLQAATLSRNYIGGPIVPLEASIYDVANDYLKRMNLADTSPAEEAPVRAASELAPSV